MDQPGTRTGKAERLRYCTQRTQLLAPTLLQLCADKCKQHDMQTLRRLATRPPPKKLGVILESAKFYYTVQVGVTTLAAALEVFPRLNLAEKNIVDVSLWLFLLRFVATYPDTLCGPRAWTNVELLREELADFLYMHCELNFEFQQNKKPLTVIAQREKLKFCKLHIKKLSVFLTGEPLPKDSFIQRLPRSNQCFEDYARLGLTTYSQLLMLPMSPVHAYSPAEALWEFLSVRPTRGVAELSRALFGFLEFYAVLDAAEYKQPQWGQPELGPALIEGSL